MLIVTNDAKVCLADELERRNLPQDVGLRLVEGEERGLDLVPDTARIDDVVVECRGRRRVVLLVEPDLANALGGRMLDTVETAEGLNFRLF